MGCLDLSALVDAGIGSLVGDENTAAASGVTFSQLSTNTRSISSGDLFVALVGEQFDAHQFLAEAVSKGACALVVEASTSVDLPKDVPCLQVKDTKIALGEISRLWLSEHHSADLKKVAITGSCGKTTTKELIGSILSVSNKVLVTSGNLNNEIGLPLTLMRLTKEHEMAVLELGANHVGEIAWTAGIAKPDVSLITCVGEAHLEGFGSVEAISRAKGEIYDALPDSGCAVVNFDDQFAPQWLAQVKGKKVLTFSIYNTKPADILLSQASYVPGEGSLMSVKTPAGQLELKTQLLGEHNWSNVLAAVAAVLPLGVSLADIAAGVAQVKPYKGRLNLQKSVIADWLLIDDTYNANPTSVRAAIDVLATCKGKRVLVLGFMAELGPNTPQLHHDIGQYARDRHIDELIAVGKCAQETCRGFGAGHAFETQDEAIAYLKTLTAEPCALLIKGSRSAAMENVVAAFSA